jgi:hypothetical protein
MSGNQDKNSSKKKPTAKKRKIIFIRKIDKKTNQLLDQLETFFNKKRAPSNLIRAGEMLFVHLKQIESLKKTISDLNVKLANEQENSVSLIEDVAELLNEGEDIKKKAANHEERKIEFYKKIQSQQKTLTKQINSNHLKMLYD